MNATMGWAALALVAGVATMAGSAWAEEAEAAEAAAVVTYKQLHAFDFNAEGSPGDSGLVKGPDGYFYGTADMGGDFGGGTIFRMAANGATQTLHHFGLAGDGRVPRGLTWGPDGHFYGVTSSGGAVGDGTFYRMSLDGAVTVLYSFDKDRELGHAPSYAVTLSSDGNFYGVTSVGGGTVYRMTPSGQHSMLHMFEDDGIEGLGPWGGVIEDGAGNLYGTTFGGGIYGNGTVYRMTKTGAMKILHAFGRPRGDGAGPLASLLKVGKMLYGVTREGGTSGQGTIYRVSTTGSSYQRLHSFSTLAGAPYSAHSSLVQAPDGYLYGTTTLGGAADKGTVYRIDLDGLLTQLHSFGQRRGDGTWPTAGLLPAGKSSFYGTTSHGGASNAGTAYKLTVTN